VSAAVRTSTAADPRAVDGADGEPTVIFLHIGKTAGATLRRILRRNVPSARCMELVNPSSAPHGFLSTIPIERFAALGERERSRPRLIMAHMVFGIHELVPRPATYVTLLRHPVARAISGYKNARYSPGHRNHAIVVSEGMDLAAYLRSGLALELDNSQTRAFIGDIDTPYGACTEAMLDAALENLEQRFAVAGVAERFDESLLALRRAFGWSRLHYVRANVSRRRIPQESIPERTIALIEEQNRFDLRLYGHALRRLEQQTVGAAASFPRELERFRRENRAYRPIGTLTYTLPKRLRSSLASRG
jgi:hypothetical protein